MDKFDAIDASYEGNSPTNNSIYSKKSLKSASINTKSNSVDRRRSFLESQKHNRRNLTTLLRDMDSTYNSTSSSNSSHSSFWSSHFLIPETINSSTLFPSELTQDYFGSYIPTGERLLITSGKGVTKAWRSDGSLWSSWSSYLPGGWKAKDATFNKSQRAVLEVIWNESTKSFTAIDILLWKQLFVIDESFDMRVFMLQSKLTEEPRLSSKSSLNQYPILTSWSFCLNSTDLLTWISSAPSQNQLDFQSLRLYHKSSIYTVDGQMNPLVIEISRTSLF